MSPLNHLRKAILSVMLEKRRVVDFIQPIYISGLSISLEAFIVMPNKQQQAKAFGEDYTEENYRNGQLKSTYVYDNNERNGEFVQYTAIGLISSTGMYQNDQKTGLWCDYDSLGIKLNCLKYQNGVLK